MDTILLQDISFDLDADALLKRLRIRSDTDAADLRRLLEEAFSLARPGAGYRAVYLEEVGEDQVRIAGTVFQSRVLAVNLRDAHRVFLYVATCGTALDRWAHSLGDMVHQYWAEEIKAAALRAATGALYARIDADYSPGKTSIMNPGSLADWPLSQQQPFFTLMREAAEALGVTLSESCLMTPNKSVTGIRFPLETGFQSCQLCPMAACPGRRAPYDSELYAREYGRGPA
ncbi:MAG: vitamin B12 dependent methionine synthase [Chloroflexi bacterium]|nr:vitamin B12 dependent methionine synthase [Chloroflexota bacterium]